MPGGHSPALAHAATLSPELLPPRARTGEGWITGGQLPSGPHGISTAKTNGPPLLTFKLLFSTLIVTFAFEMCKMLSNRI